MSDDGTVNKAFLGKPDGIRKAGRPKLRCLDCIENERRTQIRIGHHSEGGSG
jgi:hypothetical protein